MRWGPGETIALSSQTNILTSHILIVTLTLTLFKFEKASNPNCSYFHTLTLTLILTLTLQLLSIIAQHTASAYYTSNIDRGVNQIGIGNTVRK